MSIRSSQVTLALVDRASRPARWQGWLRRTARVVVAWHERARQRRDLRSLDERMLKDIGLGRADIDAETAKPFWHP